MARTVIIRQTWRCPVCSSEWDTPLYNTLLCPHCSQGIVGRETDPARCGTLTVMGAEDIEIEIAETTVAQRLARREKERLRRGRASLTPAERAQTGPAETDAYRADRLLDIAHAIGEARKREYIP